MTPARTATLIAVAMLLPTIIFGSTIVAFNSYNSRRDVEVATLDRARRIMSDIDADLARSAGALRLLATSGPVRAGDWPAARRRAREVVALTEDWQSVTLLDLAKDQVIFTTDPAGMPSLTRHMFNGQLATDTVSYGGVARRSGRCICILLAQRLDVAGQFVLLVEVDPKHIQELLVASTPADAVAAVVDRRGMFVARTVDHANRIGTPATIYVRNAIRSEKEGLYRGKTYEGLDNLTAYATSRVTGWSTHMAVSSKLVAEPFQRFRVALALAALAALLCALIVIWIVNRVLADRRTTETRLREAQHLEALGRLSGGVAHDFNNMLAIIVGNLEMAQRSPDLPARTRRNLAAAMQGAQNAADLTRRMLAYARRQSLSPAAVNPCDVVQDISVLLERTIGDHIRLRLDIDDGCWLVWADRSELENAIVNLVINARDAMPQGGEIVIAIRNIASGTEVAGDPVRSDSILFCVKDTGQGIPPEILDRVTDPFFSTKGPGRGTGLGLSQVYGFARQSGGDLRINSTVGKGTDVYMLLPRDRGTHSSDAMTAMPEEESERLPRLRILLVEDNRQVLETTRAALQDLDQDVSSFDQPDKALATVRAGGVFDLVLTDNQMAGSSGIELVSHIRNLCPNIPAIIMSALPVDGAPPGVATLAKPFSAAQLRAAIRDVT